MTHLAARLVDRIFLHSPQLEFDALSEVLGCRLTVKVETLNPAHSFKGCGADYLVAKLAEAGRREPLVCASAGNFGQAMVYACRKHGIALTVFASTHANAFKVERMHALGAAYYTSERTSMKPRRSPGNGPASVA